MNWNDMFFLALPYVTILLFFLAPVWRAFSGQWAWSARGDFEWTPRPSGFFGRRSMGMAALALHWGVITLIFGHLFLGLVGALWGPIILTDYFRWVGLAGGLMFLYGLIVALLRRILIDEVRVMSKLEDYVILCLLITAAGSALWMAIIANDFEGNWGWSSTVFPWLESILTFSPDASSMQEAPLLTKLHLIVSMLFFCYIPFTKMVHLWSYPFEYVTRPFISIRERGSWVPRPLGHQFRRRR
ncbi:MAG: respiratory nitrate reductase subunit gamma [Candidatus Thalassarchaeaceae archaeon]|nr:respiratory nitrate reductase subunit gamma [Candidatus Thalassarchaeaceae archaeon]MDP7256862.1 respiratory nitrate reductase subunit gamma [Candidatus Thalassarchaeaceae archaeon]MDP7446102.1 respiratory nitrate reductase subunit gamma [Candidatus Thalassarchaeaceae archaeon]MDP7649456.1 respiratory nitrate reductase subunit gamma [Candidatus Thalassarchaeaceae archaeon]HJL55430.1 respiratory nitrate reductase subunit gamma [Candidatus Thalassarchaeaceae archaeon]